MSSKDDTPFEFVEAKEGRRTKYRGIQGNKRKMKKKRCDFGVFYPLDEGSSRGSPSSVITTFVGQPVLCNTGGQTNGSVWETGSNLRVDSSAPTQLEETTSSQGQRLSSQSGPFCGRSFFTTMSSTSRPVLPEGNDIDLTDEEAANDWFDVVDTTVCTEEISLEGQSHLYLIELQRLEAITALDNQSTEFAVPTWDNERKALSANKHVVIERKTAAFGDTIEWVYGCSCNPAHQTFISNLNRNLDCTSEELQTLQEQCLHVSVVSKILRTFDIRNDISPYSSSVVNNQVVKFNVVELQNEPNRLCIRVDGKIGFIGIDQGKLKCLTCRYDTTKCPHVNLLRQLTSEGASDIPDVAFELVSKEREWEPMAFTLLLPVSSQKIPYEISSELGSKLSAGYMSFLEKSEQFYRLSPLASNCPECGFVFVESSAVTRTLYTISSAISCIVVSKTCPNCVYVEQYDGGNDGILNMGRFLIGYDVLKDYLYHFVFSNSCTLHGYYNIWRERFADYSIADLRKDVSYQHWRASWYAYLSLLDIDFEQWNVCDKCGSSPDIIICDGTSLGFRKQLLLMTADDQNSDGNVIKRASFYKDRMAVEDALCRELMEKWVKGLKSSVRGMLSVLEKENLESLLEEKYPAIQNIYCWVQETYPNVPIKALSTLFSCLCSKSPVCSYIPPSVCSQHLISKLCTVDIKSLPSLFKSLRDEIPVLYDVLCGIEGGRFPLSWQSLLTWLCEKSLQIFCINDAPSVNDVVSRDDSLAFFPTLPKQRERGKFEMDVKTAKEESCTKKSHGHPTLTPGIFTIYCPHGLNYGFQAMESHESPNVPFSVFRTRFFKAPEVIVYDNCCNLHAYCLNRDPVFFKDTKFLVDRFHWKNHTGCCCAYNISSWPKFDWINSQVNEQQNATIKRLRSQLSYMGPEKFMDHCKLFLWFRNKLNKRS